METKKQNIYKTMTEAEFTEYKKLAVDVTLQLEESVKLFKEFLNLRNGYYDEGYELNNNQHEEIKEYVNRFDNCLDFLSDFV